VTDAFAAAAEPTRRRILQLLARRPLFVTDLAANFDVTRSAISQHLAVLESAGLVRTRRQGRYKFHDLTPEPLERIAARWLKSDTKETEDENPPVERIRR